MATNSAKKTASSNNAKQMKFTVPETTPKMRKWFNAMANLAAALRADAEKNPDPAKQKPVLKMAIEDLQFDAPMLICAMNNGTCGGSLDPKTETLTGLDPEMKGIEAAMYIEESILAPGRADANAELMCKIKEIMELSEDLASKKQDEDDDS